MSAEAREQEVVQGWSGDQLRVARQRMGLTPEQVERQLFFQPGYVDAIESGNFKRLPGALFVKGYIRAYAKLLHVSSHQLLQEFQDRFVDYLPVPEIEHKSTPPNKAVWEQKVVASRQGITWQVWLLVPLVIVLLIAVCWPQLTPVINRMLAPLSLNLPSAPTQKIIAADTTTNLITPNQVNETQVLQLQDGDTSTAQDVQINPSEINEAATGTQPGITGEDATITQQQATPTMTMETVMPEEEDMASMVSVNVLEDGRWQIGTHDAAVAIDNLKIKLKSSTWLQIVDAAGVNHPRKSYAANALVNIKGQAPFTLSVGDIKAIDMQFNQKEVSL